MDIQRRGNRMLQRMIGAAALNRGTYEDVEHDRGATGQAALIVVLASISGAVGGVLSGDTSWIMGLILGVVSGVVWWALWALGCWIVGTTMLNTPNTRADWGELARGLGCAATPGLFGALTAIPYIGWIVAIVLFVWRFAAVLMAVQATLDYTSMWRAFFVVLIAFIPVLIVTIIIFAILSAVGLQEAEQTARLLPGIFNITGA